MNKNIITILPLLAASILFSSCSSDESSPFTQGGGSSTNIVSAANFGVGADNFEPDVIEFQAGSITPGSNTGSFSNIVSITGSVAVEITATAADNEGALINTGTIFFSTQYGVLSASSCILEDGKCSVTWESILDLSALDLGGGVIDISNIVTAWTYGSEGFSDLDGDDRLSDSEFFFDTESPYLDRNGNGIYDAAIDDTILPNPYEPPNNLFDGPGCDTSTRIDCGSSSLIPIFTSVSLRLNYDSTTVTALNVTLDSPADATRALFGTNINFTATGFDPQDGPLTGTSITWSSNIDGSFGISGENINFAGLSVNTHTITVVATDSDSNATTDTITLTITAAPTVTLDTPADGASVAAGTIVNFTATAIDNEDGTITGLNTPVVGNNIVWSSSFEGNFGGNSDNISFDTTGWTVGAHTITVTVTDSDGNTVTDTITLNIT